VAGHALRQNLFKGAAAEYKAASYYLERGEIVYWPAVPLESDFIVERKDGRLEKIQVKYSSWNKATGNCEKLHCRTYGWNGGRTASDAGPQYDFLFVISEDGRFWEIPANKLPKHAIGLDTRGGSHKKTGTHVRKWDEYLVSPLNEREH
jgi:hypothetical protein